MPGKAEMECKYKNQKVRPSIMYRASKILIMFQVTYKKGYSASIIYFCVCLFYEILRK
jgi:hypothetical protein